MKVSATIVSRRDPKAKVRIALNATAAQKYSFVNTAMRSIRNKNQPILSKNLLLTFHAIEAAHISGVFYAKHRIGAKALTVELISFYADGPVENSIPFAVATTVAIYDAVFGIRDYTEADLSGWDVLSLERETS